MRKMLIEYYNAVVPKDGVCFFLGDMGMLGTSQWERLGGLLKKLNGTKHLILGNHDEMKPFTYVNTGFTSVHTSLEVILQIEGIPTKFILNHDPCVWDLVPDDVVLLCGHIHNLFKILPQQNTINVGVDVWNYRPISILEAWNALQKWKVDYNAKLDFDNSQLNHTPMPTPWRVYPPSAREGVTDPYKEDE
jgi:calcineurin-like phosphoesterase family protein